MAVRCRGQELLRAPSAFCPPYGGLPSSPGCDEKGTPHRLGRLRAEVGKHSKESRPVCGVKDV